MKVKALIQVPLFIIPFLVILFFNLIAVYLKTSKCETIARHMFPVIVLFLFLIELATTLPPALNVQADSSQRFLLSHKIFPSKCILSCYLVLHQVV